MNEPDIGSMDDVMTSDERPIRQFTLRGNPKVEALVQKLHDLGVTECRFLTRVREPTDYDTFASTPSLRGGRDYSAKSIRAIAIAQEFLGYAIADEVVTLVAETEVGGFQLLVEVFVSVERRSEPPLIVTFVTGIDACSRDFDGLTIQLL